MFAQGEILTGSSSGPSSYRPWPSIAAPEPVATRTRLWSRTVRLPGGRFASGARPMQTGDSGRLKPGDLLVAEQRIELADGVGVTPGK